MSRNHRPELNAILLQLVAELHAYASLVQGLADEWQARQDVVMFGEPGQAMDRMRSLAAAIPPLSVQWVMVMISHTELMHNLWRMTRGEPLDVAAEVGDHLACVEALAVKCRLLLSQGGHVLH
ncbi:hypothetical protein H8N03_00500 [Ramlibacter sp. USB13]|uniref:Uncharacterized protein n=1 Tax=Ramlibacter cellulosilyticus TaxID=2764187 RepID=A0A923MNN3_9BURK|nr:hypothetical protein [Ramlibacter cellulosilyticus]MBC5781399.1 hypothetical protein [Ramlibacter cellulosilyticus]